MRERLITETAQVIARGGAGALSLRSLAAACETSTTAVYRLFGGRGQLLDAAFTRVASAFVRAQREAPRHDEPIEDLLELARAYRNWAFAQPHAFHVLFGTPRAEQGECPPAGAGSRAPLHDRIERAIARGALEGPAEQIALTLWSAVHGFVLMELAGVLPAGGDVAFEAVARAACRAWEPR